jgi:hypothetical protein
MILGQVLVLFIATYLSIIASYRSKSLVAGFLLLSDFLSL